MSLHLIPAASLGLVDDPDTELDPLPAREPPYTVDAGCAEHDATIAALRAEVARLNKDLAECRVVLRREREWLRADVAAMGSELAMLRAERSTLGRRAAVLEASEGGGE